MKAQYLTPQPVLPIVEIFGDAVREWPPHFENKKQRLGHEPTRYVMAPAGAINSHPDCWRLVLAGSCRPFDKACQVAAGLTDAQVAERYARYQQLEKGELYVADEDEDQEDDEVITPK